SVNKLYVQFGNCLTLLGLLAIDPENKRVGDLERAILGIRDLLIGNPDKRTVSAAELADRISVDSSYAEQLLGLLSGSFSFWSSAQGATSGCGHSAITVDREEGLRALLSFESLEDHLEAHVAQQKEPSQNSRTTVPNQQIVPDIEPDLDWYQRISAAQS